MASTTGNNPQAGNINNNPQAGNNNNQQGNSSNYIGALRGISNIRTSIDNASTIIERRINQAAQQITGGFTSGINTLNSTIQSAITNTTQNSGNTNNNSTATSGFMSGVSNTLGNIDRNVASILSLMQAMGNQSAQNGAQIPPTPQPTVAPAIPSPPSGGSGGTSGGGGGGSSTGGGSSSSGSSSVGSTARGLVSSIGGGAFKVLGFTIGLGVKAIGFGIGAMTTIITKAVSLARKIGRTVFNAVDKLSSAFTDFATKGFDETTKSFGEQLIGAIPIIGKLLAAVWGKGIDNLHNSDKYSTEFARANGEGSVGKGYANSTINNTRRRYLGSDPLLTNEVIGQALTEHAKASGGRESKLTTKDLFSSIELNKFGVNAQDLSKFSDMGMSASTTKKWAEQLYGDASKKGLSFQKVSENVKNNLNLAQKYTFKDGVKGLTRMAEQSAALKTNMAMASSFADKVSNLQGATEASAKLSVLGGNFANQANPLTMMSNSLLDFEEFNKNIDETLKGFAEFKDGQYQMSAFNKQQLKAYQEATGMDYEELYNRAINGQKMEDIKAQAGGKLSDAALQYVMNQGQMDENGNAYVSDDNGNKVDIKNMSAEQVQMLEGKAKEAGRTEKDVLEDIYKATMSNNERFEGMFNKFTERFMPFIENIYNWLATNLGPIMQGVFNFLGDVIIPFINDVVTPIFKDIVVPFITDVVEPLAVDFGNFIKSDLMPFIKDEVVPFIEDNLKPLVKKAVPFIEGLLKWAWDVVKPIVKSIWSVLNNTIVPLWKETLWPFIKNYIMPGIKKIGQWIAELLPPVAKAVGHIISIALKIAKPIINVLSPVIEAIYKGIKWIVEGLSDFLGWVDSKLGDVDTSDKSGINEEDDISAKIDSLVDGFANQKDTIPDETKFKENFGTGNGISEENDNVTSSTFLVDTSNSDRNTNITPNETSSSMYTQVNNSQTNNSGGGATNVSFEPLKIDIGGTLKIDLGGYQGQIDGNKLLNNKTFLNALVDKISGAVGTKYHSMVSRSVPKEEMSQNGTWLG